MSISQLHFSEANFVSRNPHSFKESYVELCQKFIRQHGQSYTAWKADGKGTVVQAIGPAPFVVAEDG